MSYTEVSLLLKAFDTDNDKKIEMKEWCEGMKKYMKIPPKVESTEVKTDFDRWAAPVAARKLLHAFAARNLQVDTAFYRIDTGRDGSISLTELKHGINSILPKDLFNLGEINMAFKYFDANANGRVSRKEWNDTFKRLAAKEADEKAVLIKRRNEKY